MNDEIQVPEWSGSIVALTKIGKKEHLSKLQEGILRFRDLNFYTRKENQMNGWYDPREQVRGIYQADKIKIKIQSGDEGILLDASTGLTNQAYFGFAKTNQRILCFHTLANGIWPGNDIIETDEVSCGAHFKIPSNLKEKFGGEYIWLILNPKEFLSRLKKAVEAIPDMPHGVRFSPVHYVDFKKVHGDIPEQDVGFVKDIRFSEEKEFRLIANSKERLPDPFELQIGNLTDISLIITLDEFNQTYRAKFVELEEPEEDISV